MASYLLKKKKKIGDMIVDIVEIVRWFWEVIVRMDMGHDKIRKGGGERERIRVGGKKGGKMGWRKKGKKEGEHKIQGMNEQKEAFGDSL